MESFRLPSSTRKRGPYLVPEPTEVLLVGLVVPFYVDGGRECLGQLLVGVLCTHMCVFAQQISCGKRTDGFSGTTICFQA